MDKYVHEKEKDALFRGEFEVVKELMAELEDAAKAFLKIKIMDNIHKYFYLITFTAYLREQARSAVGGITDDQKKDFGLTGGKVSAPTESLKVSKSFQDYMGE